jgi:hypothetical protein
MESVYVHEWLKNLTADLQRYVVEALLANPDMKVGDKIDLPLNLIIRLVKAKSGDVNAIYGPPEMFPDLGTPTITVDHELEDH